MKYIDGSLVKLGDIVKVPVPSGKAKARVVMLGESYEHLDIDAGFVAWVTKEKKLEKTDVVVEWLGNNPFAHNDPRYAPVGNFMFTAIDEHVERDA